MSGDGSKNLLAAHSIDKSFPGVKALSAVDFVLESGQVHALVGENGAGKSTLTRILAGIEKADSGRMSLLGREYEPKSRAEAEKQGVRMVMQELNLIDNLSIAENIFIEGMPNVLGFIRRSKLHRDAREVMKRVGLEDIEPGTLVSRLGVGQQQMVEIAAGLSRECRVLILDEPTASLTDHETELLFAQIERLKSQGVGIIYISHRIEEVMRIADMVTVLRDGKLVGTKPKSELSIREIIRLMVGREFSEHGIEQHSGMNEVALRVEGLSVGDKVKDVSFEVRKGEILGVAGLMGSGRTETMRAIFGADKADSGKIYLHGAGSATRIRSPREAVRKGIAFLTEDRKQQGLFLPLTVRANTSFARLWKVSRAGLVSRTLESSVAEKYVAGLGIRCSSVEQRVGQLSGGNQQKVVIAKWLFRDCDVLIFDEPTRGIDVGAKFEIYRMFRDMAQRDKALIVVSSDLNELMGVCDRIMVMSAGRVAGTFERAGWSEEAIMAAAFSEYVKAKPKETV